MMPAGKYYVGDLCYVMHDEWNEFCKLTIVDGSCIDGEFNLSDGRRFATYGTAYGDGVYQSSNGARLGVDAGLIGCIRVEDIRENKTLEDLNELGTVVEFSHEFATRGGRTVDNWDGMIRFGNITIDTSSDDGDYDYENDDENEDQYENS